MIDDRAHELIHGDIDGVNGADEQRELQALIEASAEVRREHAQMKELTGALDALPSCEPPPRLRQALRAGIPAAVAPAQRRMLRPGSRAFAALAMAAAVTGVAVLLLREPAVQELDPAALAGTIGRPAAGQAEASMVINERFVTGIVRLRRFERGLAMELDIDTSHPLTVVATGDGPLGLEGFVPLSGAPTRVVEEGGVIRLVHDGRQHYSLVLPSGRDPVRVVDLALYIDEQLINQTRLYVPSEGTPAQR